MSENPVLRKEWEKIKRELEIGAYFLTPSLYLSEAYALLAKGTISKEELLESIKSGAEYYKSEKFVGELGRKRRTIEADEVIRGIKKSSTTEIRGYKIPDRGDIMIREGMMYVGFCTPSAAKQYFPRQEIGSKYEIRLPTSLELVRFERQLLEKSPAELHLFPKMKSAKPY
ncbi:MAG: hypothetical protein NTX24_02940 [Candidatus Pacearchaeota archaeon]|nr:hypothetical protein [Candidatus Pacearchaeota archaeon]